MINARAETVAQKRSFARAFKRHRCLVVADGFYEWKKLEDKKFKIPYYFHLRSERPFGFAGLYGTWKSKDGTVLTTCTIITTQPNKIMKPIHNRMPAIIPREQRAMWLDRDVEDPDVLLPLLHPYTAEEMEMYEVARTVNSPKYNEPDCIKPVTSFKQDSLI
jgi:putative SOS response-associated peptidase YedK